MMRPLAICFVASFLLFGCMSIQRHGMTTYDQYIDDTGTRMFKFMAMSTVFYPTDSSDAESTRMKLLDEWLLDNNYCQNGFEIVNKKLISRSSDPNAKNITYFGKCK